MAENHLYGSELPEYRDPGGWEGNFGELPDDLREVGDPSEPGSPSVGVTGEGDHYALTGGADRNFVQPVPPVQATKFVGVNALPRYNYESFRSQRFEQIGYGVLLPTSGNTFTNLATFNIPATFAGMLTGFTQWIGDASAYLKSNGTQDDITWRITVNDALAFSYGALHGIVSTATHEGKLFVILNENTSVTIAATNNIPAGSFGAKAIPVRATISGYQFPLDEIDDIFRNK